MVCFEIAKPNNFRGCPASVTTTYLEGYAVMSYPPSTKVCIKCQIEKPVLEFHKKKGAKDNLRNICKACSSAHNKANREKSAGYFKQYRIEHREQKAATDKAYKNKNKERLSEYGRKRYQENKEIISKKAKIYRQNNKEKIAEQNRIYRENNKEKIAKQKADYRKEHRKESIKRSKDYYEANKDACLETSRSYRKNNKEELKQYFKEYTEKNKEKIGKRQREYSKANKEKIRERTRKWVKNNPEKTRASTRKANHVRRARLKHATIEDFNPSEVFKRDGYVCQLCGCKTSLRYKSQYHPKRTELDHIIPISLGGEHSLRNTQCACHRCNIEKNNTGTGDQLRLFG